MASAPPRFPSDRPERLERNLRARAAQLKPLEPRRPTATPVGLCPACSTIVYAGDSLAMVGISVFHADCCVTAADPAEVA